MRSKEIMKHKAMYVKEWAYINDNEGAKEAANQVLSALKSKDFDMHDLINSEAWKTVIRVFYS